MIWADRVAKEIITSGKYKPFWVDDMKTPSGRVHVGSLRGVVLHDLIYKAFINKGVKAKFTYVFEDHDPMDALPVYLDKQKWSKYLGQPLFTIPSPDGQAQNYARYFANEFQHVFNSIGCKPKIIWVSHLYKQGKMNNSIRLCLDRATVIREIYKELYKKKISDDWFPFQAVCPNCGKESTTRVTGWDGKEVSFACKVDAVTWTKGCGETGRMSPFSSNGSYAGKLPWKVEWAVKWKVIGVTIEGAGKDHMTAGGSHDVARLVCQRVLDYPVPYPFSYEFFLVADKKMSSSKGLGTSAKEVSQMLPPQVLRFLIVRMRINQPINFDPRGMTIPDLFDEYDRCALAYWEKTDASLARIFELSQVDGLAKKKLFLPRFRTVANYLQMPSVDLGQKFAAEKRARLNREELVILEERLHYARLWMKSFAPEEVKFAVKEKMPKEADSLSQTQKVYLRHIAEVLTSKKLAVEGLEKILYNLAKEVNLPTKDAFAAIYIALLGKPHGPKATSLLLTLDKKFVVDRFSNL